MSGRRKVWNLDTGRAIVGARRLGRKVRVHINAREDLGFVGAINAATFAFADLDDEQIDQLIGRLQRIRGGNKTLPKPTRPPVPHCPVMRGRS